MIVDRQGEVLVKDDAKKSQKFLYRTFLGRVLLKILTRPFVSRLVGKYKSGRASARGVKKFVAKNNIDMSDYENREYLSFNDFFTRRIKDGARRIDDTPAHLIAPCDGKLSVYTADEKGVYSIKNSYYDIADITGKENAAKFYGGTLLVFRLTVDDFHRYSFFDGGTAEETVKIKGELHTVNPIAMERYKVFSKNAREYTLLHTDNFGDAVFAEIGALMVGKIVNSGKREFSRGEEKGYFEFGGSTVIVVLGKGAVTIDGDILKNSADGNETKVRLGEKIGEKAGVTAGERSEKSAR